MYPVSAAHYLWNLFLEIEDSNFNTHWKSFQLLSVAFQSIFGVNGHIDMYLDMKSLFPKGARSIFD